MKKYKYIFGPVLSRRLGVSLGVDLVPYKTCSFDCLYCECGGTTDKTIKRKVYINAEKIIKEIDDYLKTNPELDYVTLGGSGEPTLNKDLSKIIDFVKDKYPEYKVAVLTNSSLFGDKDVFDSLLRADLVVPSLDSGRQETFEKINRPCQGIVLEEMINNLIEFSKEYKGKIWLEIFLIPGINDNDQELDCIKNHIEKMRVDRVDLNTLDRPGTDVSVTAMSYENLQKAAEKFKEFNVNVLSRDKQKKKIVYDHEHHEKQYRLKYAIISAIKRRPCTFDDLSGMFNVDKEVLRDLLSGMVEKGNIKVVAQGGLEFYEI
ncbi:radical SAM protein [bacterium]|nr:radical SAM protein [bacterium]